MIETKPHLRRAGILLLAAGLLAAACGSEAADDAAAVTTVPDAVDESSAEVADTDAAEAIDGQSTDAEVSDQSGQTSTFQIDIWADNWMAVYVDGELVGEDSVSITTERSFNAEVFTFEATYPFTLAIEAKDFKETDSGLEYIGENNQQMGDGGVIAQVTDTATGEVVAATDASWATLVVHQAPLNTECEDDADPDATCEFAIIETPSDWTAVDFDDSGWVDATVWSEAAVDPKIGYDDISWDVTAALVWGADLEVDNTVLLRTTISG